MGSLTIVLGGDVFLYLDSWVGVNRRSRKRQVATLTKRCNGGVNLIIV